jgi:hypothetical protein
MQDLKRKSDKAELDNHHNGNDPMAGLDGAGRKAWLLSEMRLMQDHYKVGRTAYLGCRLRGDCIGGLCRKLNDDDFL